jgi:hypothetical protein
MSFKKQEGGNSKGYNEDMKFGLLEEEKGVTLVLGLHSKREQFLLTLVKD